MARLASLGVKICAILGVMDLDGIVMLVNLGT